MLLADVLPDTGGGGIAPALPPEDPPMVRRLLRQLREARESTRRIVGMVLAELEKLGNGVAHTRWIVYD